MRHNDIQRSIEDFAAALADLRIHAGKPSFARIQRLSKSQDSPASERRTVSLPSTTASDAVRGRRLPAAATVLAFVDACHRAAEEDGVVIEARRFDPAMWQQRWRLVHDLRHTQNETPQSSRPDTVISAPAAHLPGGDEPAVVTSGLTQQRDRVEQLSRTYAARLGGLCGKALRTRRKLEQEALDELNLLVSTELNGAPAGPPEAHPILRGRTLAPPVQDGGSPLVGAEGEAVRYSKELAPCLSALLMAELQQHRAADLNRPENAALADIYRRIASWMLAYGLFTHAALAYGRAAAAHHRNEEWASRDRCNRDSLRAKRKALPPGLRNLAMAAADAFCGYAYLPFRMITWMAVQIIIGMLVFFLYLDRPEDPPFWR